MTTPPILSVSQAEKFDAEQLGGCPRRWWFEDVRKLRPDDTTAHEDGHQGHRLLAQYLRTGERPGRVRLGKAVNAVIDSGALPAPGPHLEVEQRFSGQPHYDAAGAFVPLDTSRTLWHAGHPWEGFIDLRFRRGPARAVWVWDHKFSSDIHARALPEERLIRTVQLPIYALDSLRVWPDATVFNLVHLYVSRRGVESFVRQQSVTVEQVRERAEEVAGLVDQMDAVRTAAAQDDVPFNRAACHARMGCPHQFRCNAFRRRNTMMDLNDEEKALFFMASEKPTAPERGVGAQATHHPAGPLPVSGTGTVTMELRTPTLARVSEPLERPDAGRVTPPDALNLDDIFDDMPKPSAPKPQPAPTCEACSEVLTPENSSRLKTGDVKHIGCPKGGINLADGGAITVDPLPASGPKCADCPHPAHAGKPCEGKRGRGKCQCGATVEQPQRPPVPPAPRFDVSGTVTARVNGGGKPKQSAAELQALADEAAAAADVDGDGAAVEEARQLRDAAEQARREETPESPRPREPVARIRADLLREALATSPEPGPCPAPCTVPPEQCCGNPEPLNPDEMRAARKLAEVEGRTFPAAAQDDATAPLDRPLTPPTGSWSGTLAINFTVELGPATLAFLARFLPRG